MKITAMREKEQSHTTREQEMTLEDPSPHTLEMNRIGTTATTMIELHIDTIDHTTPKTPITTPIPATNHTTSTHMETTRQYTTTNPMEATKKPTRKNLYSRIK